ncbi:hypothetical protein EHV15_26545 [Paenibacillus oralis]|uniref:Transposase DDE domain-containing protein n=1 Tax=Paenibacillus oralis TaxID=2490856 RepID=A0A3P3U8P8_9BACL|nr:hypothetical protein EHV15_26545 [Paenibacillus oralis]
MDVEDKNVMANCRLHKQDPRTAGREAGASGLPSCKHRTVQRPTGGVVFKERHLGECLFSKLKHNRRLATWYDKLPCTFFSFLELASAMVWLVKF